MEVKAKTEMVMLTYEEWEDAQSLAHVLLHLPANTRELLCAVALDLAEQAEARR